MCVGVCKCTCCRVCVRVHLCMCVRARDLEREFPSGGLALNSGKPAVLGVRVEKWW